MMTIQLRDLKIRRKQKVFTLEEMIKSIFYCNVTLPFFYFIHLFINRDICEAILNIA